VQAVLPAIESDLSALGAVPHWGKVTTMSPPDIRSRIPQLVAFRDLVLSLDPHGKFRNAYLDRLLFDGS
jgi:xylitol oxidase